MEIRNTKAEAYKSILYKPYYEKARSKENAPPNQATISQKELERIRSTATSLGISETLMKAKQTGALTLTKELNENKKKKGTKQLDKDTLIAQIEQLKKETNAVDELQREKERELARQKTEQAKTNSLDEVKQINQLAASAQVAAIRDQQLKEKKEIYKSKVEEIKRLDLVMEIERVKGLKEEAEREQKRAEEARAGRAVIVDQIKLNHMRRLKEKEEAAEEATELLRRTKALQQEDLQKAEEKKKFIAKTQDEIVAANERAIGKKKEIIEIEKAENAKIAAYLKEKSEKEFAQTQEILRIKAEKEQEVARLREKQEKEHDLISELDQLRAKRAQQERERAMLEKELKEAAEAAKRDAELKVAREEQALAKTQKLYEQAKSDKIEFDKTIEVQKKLREAERQAETDNAEKRKKHADALKEQIVLKEEGVAQLRRDKQEEGLRLKRHQSEIKQRIKKEQTEKVKLLVEKGISDKYRADLERKKF